MHYWFMSLPMNTPADPASARGPPWRWTSGSDAPPRSLTAGPPGAAAANFITAHFGQPLRCRGGSWRRVLMLPPFVLKNPWITCGSSYPAETGQRLHAQAVFRTDLTRSTEISVSMHATCGLSEKATARMICSGRSGTAAMMKHAPLRSGTRRKCRKRRNAGRIITCSAGKCIRAGARIVSARKRTQDTTCWGVRPWVQERKCRLGQ